MPSDEISAMATLYGRGDAGGSLAANRSLRSLPTFALLVISLAAFLAS